MLHCMTSPADHSPPTRRQRQWTPVWARVLAWIVLVPSALGFVLGVRFIVQGFGPETLAAVGLIVGPLLILLVIAIAVPALIFLRQGGKTPFFISIGIAAAALLFVLPSAF